MPTPIASLLRRQRPLIAPSMLKCDFGNMHREIELLEQGGAEILHLDVMDGHFVPNLTYGPVVIERIRQLTRLPFDTHLMITSPEQWIDSYVDAGCDAITIHLEATDDPAAALRQIRSHGLPAGLAVNPETPAEAVVPLLPECDNVLIMSVRPGFGGQAFQPESLEKLRFLKQAAGPEGPVFSIDGGIGKETIGQAAQAGATLFVAGSAIFDAADYGAAISELAGIAIASSTEAEA